MQGGILLPHATAAAAAAAAPAAALDAQSEAFVLGPDNAGQPIQLRGRTAEGQGEWSLESLCITVRLQLLEAAVSSRLLCICLCLYLVKCVELAQCRSVAAVLEETAKRKRRRAEEEEERRAVVVYGEPPLPNGGAAAAAAAVAMAAEDTDEEDEDASDAEPTLGDRVAALQVGYNVVMVVYITILDDFLHDLGRSYNLLLEDSCLDQCN